MNDARATSAAMDTSPQANPDVIEMFTRLLADAKAGKIVTAACVLVSPISGVATAWVGPQTFPLYFGVDFLKSVLMTAINAPKKLITAPPR